MALNSKRRRRLRERFVAAQAGRCRYCRRTFLPDGPLRATLEHLEAKMDGGRDRVDNLAAAGWHCNQHRARQTLRDRRAVAAAAAREATVPDQ